MPDLAVRSIAEMEDSTSEVARVRAILGVAIDGEKRTVKRIASKEIEPTSRTSQLAKDSDLEDYHPTNRFLVSNGD